MTSRHYPLNRHDLFTDRHHFGDPLQIGCIGHECSLCQKDASKHLDTISVTDISTEYDLTLARAGVFEYDEEYTAISKKVALVIHDA